MYGGGMEGGQSLRDVGQGETKSRASGLDHGEREGVIWAEPQEAGSVAWKDLTANVKKLSLHCVFLTLTAA